MNDKARRRELRAARREKRKPVLPEPSASKRGTNRYEPTMGFGPGILDLASGEFRPLSRAVARTPHDLASEQFEDWGFEELECECGVCSEPLELNEPGSGGACFDWSHPDSSPRCAAWVAELNRGLVEQSDAFRQACDEEEGEEEDERGVA